MIRFTMGRVQTHLMRSNGDDLRVLSSETALRLGQSIGPAETKDSLLRDLPTNWAISGYIATTKPEAEDWWHFTLKEWSPGDFVMWYQDKDGKKFSVCDDAASFMGIGNVENTIPVVRELWIKIDEAGAA